MAAPAELVRNTGRPTGRLLFRLRMLHLHGWRVRGSPIPTASLGSWPADVETLFTCLRAPCCLLTDDACQGEAAF